MHSVNSFERAGVFGSNTFSNSKISFCLISVTNALTNCVKKHSHVGCLLWRQNNPEVNYSATQNSAGGVFDNQEVGCGYMDWIGLAQDRDRWRTLVSAVMNLWVP